MRPRARVSALRQRGMATRLAATPTNAPAMNQKKAMRPPQRSLKSRAQTECAGATIHMIRVAVTMSQAADILSPTADKNAVENRQLQAFRVTGRVRRRVREWQVGEIPIREFRHRV